MGDGSGRSKDAFESLIETKGRNKANSVVVLVDDAKFIRDDFGPIISRLLGVEVLTARDGEDGLKLIQACRDSICLVLSDMNMPNMDGVTMVREATKRRLLEGVPTLIMTGLFSENEEAIFAAIDEGIIHESIVKPFSLADLLEAIRVASQKILDKMETVDAEALEDVALSA